MAARPKDAWTTVTLKPLTAALDSRAFPEDVPAGFHRDILNWILSGSSKLCRRPQHEKLFSGSAFDLLHLPADPLYAPTYNNWDFHDQSGIGGQLTRQPVTYLSEGFKNSGERYLYAGTQHNLWRLDQVIGMWTLLTAGKSFGGPAVVGVPQTRWKSGLLQNIMVFTNGVDKPQSHDVTTNTVQEIPDLNSNLDSGGVGDGPVTTADVVVSFSGFMFLMNLTQAGQKFTSRVRWSDLNRPLIWATAADSIAGFQDLDYGHDILAAAEMQGALYIYTSKSIWRATIAGAGATTAFTFVKVYAEPTNQAKCLFFPNTLVCVGTDQFYAAIDGIYRFNPYIPEPERLEWLYRGSAAIFGDTAYLGDVAFCQSPVAVAFQEDQEIHLSWPELNVAGASPGQNTKTLIWNYAYKAVSTKDFGFSAYTNFRPIPPDNACKTKQLLVGAASDDWCLKSISTIYSRERCANAATGVGSVIDGKYIPFAGQYVFDGYYSRLRGMFPFANFDRMKSLKHVLLEPHPVAQPTPCVVRCRLGISNSEADPNLPDQQCAVEWFQQKDQPLVCLDQVKPSEYQKQHITRDEAMDWWTLLTAKFLYYEFVIANPDGSPAIGGDSCFSRLETQVRVLPS